MEIAKLLMGLILSRSSDYGSRAANGDEASIRDDGRPHFATAGPFSLVQDYPPILQGSGRHIHPAHRRTRGETPLDLVRPTVWSRQAAVPFRIRREWRPTIVRFPTMKRAPR